MVLFGTNIKMTDWITKLGTMLFLLSISNGVQGDTGYLPSAYSRSSKYKLLADPKDVYVTPYAEGRVYYKAAESETPDPSYGYEYAAYPRAGSHSRPAKSKYTSDYLLKQMGEDFSDYYQGIGRYKRPKMLLRPTHSAKDMDIDLGLGYPVRSVYKSHLLKPKTLEKPMSSLVYRYESSGYNKGASVDPLESYYPGAAPVKSTISADTVYKHPMIADDEKYENYESSGKSELYSDTPLKGHFIEDYSPARYHGLNLGGYGYPTRGRHLGFYHRR